MEGVPGVELVTAWIVQVPCTFDNHQSYLWLLWFSLPSNSEVRNEWSHISTSLCAFMACMGVTSPLPLWVFDFKIMKEFFYEKKSLFSGACCEFFFISLALKCFHVCYRKAICIIHPPLPPPPSDLVLVELCSAVVNKGFHFVEHLHVICSLENALKCLKN